MFDSIQINDPFAQILIVLLGIVVLLAGRRLFWVTVAAVGFVVSLFFVVGYMQDQPAWLVLVVALAVGIIGALLAILLQEVAVAVAGFLAGGYVLVWLLQVLNINLNQWDLAAFVVAGVIGAILALYLLDIALIVLSSILGAAMILQVFQLDPVLTLVLFVVLVIIGLVAQTRLPGRQPVRVRRVQRVRREGE
jgi:hypothetical protein